MSTAETTLPGYAKSDAVVFGLRETSILTSFEKPDAIENAAEIIGYYAKTGRQMPDGIYIAEKTVVLPDGSNLVLGDGTEIRIGHAGEGFHIESGSVSFKGGTISGAKTYSNWRVENGLFVTDFTKTNKQLMVFRNGEKLPRSRYPEEGYLAINPEYVPPGNTPTFIEFTDPGLYDKLPDHPTDIELHWYGRYHFAGSTVASFSKLEQDDVRVELQSEMWFYTSDILEARFWMENLVDRIPKGQWCHDRVNGLLIYNPLDGENVDDFSVQVPLSKKLVAADFSSSARGGNISFEDVVFEYGDCDFSDGKRIFGGDVTEDNMVHLVRELDAVSFDRCVFRNSIGVGARLAEVNTSTEKTQVVFNSCRIDNVGCIGIRIGVSYRSDEWYEYPDGVYPNYGDRPLIEIDGIRCEHAGAFFKDATFFNIRAAAFGSYIRDSRFVGGDYQGVLIGGGFYSRGCLQSFDIERCLFSDLMRELHDGAHLYVVGGNYNVVIDDCLFEHVKPQVGDFGRMAFYYEAGCYDTVVKNSIFFDIAQSEAIGTKNYAGDLYFVSNKTKADLWHRTFVHLYSRHYSPLGDQEMYDQLVTTYRFPLDADPVENEDSFTVRSWYYHNWPVLSPGDPVKELKVPEGGWLYFCSGNSKGRWFKILKKHDIPPEDDYAMLDVAKIDETGQFAFDAANGDLGATIGVYCADNVLCSDDELEAHRNQWMIDHPEPITP